MPKVGKKEFPYTAKGMAMAKIEDQSEVKKDLIENNFRKMQLPVRTAWLRHLGQRCRLKS